MLNKNKKYLRPSSEDRKKVMVMTLCIIFLLSVLFIQFFKVQVIEHKKWVHKAKQQHQVTVNEPFKRGVFYSNPINNAKAQAFIIDMPKYHLYVDPFSIPTKYRKEIIKKLVNLLNIRTSEQEKYIVQQFMKKSRSRRLKMWLNSYLKEKISQWWFTYARSHHIATNALYFTRDNQRSYPFGKMLGQVLHTIRVYKQVSTKQAIPTGGLELQFHSYLKGKEGKRLLLRSPRNPLETGILLKHAEDGSDVYLTINHVLQAIAEEEIEKGVKRVHAKSGWAIIMDPYNGYILALAQYPFFYPDQYQSYYQGIAKIEDTRVHAIQDVYEPGSSFKPVTLAIALLANQALEGQGKKPIFDPEEKISTSDGRFPGRRSALTDTHFYNYMNMDLALQKSSNIYPAVLVDRIIKSLGKQWYRDQLAHIFQFGQSTGIEFPAESVGLIPRFGKKHANGALEWSVSTPYSLAIGHNLQVNALQLLRVYASFVNGGYLVNPTLLKKVVKDSTAKSPRVLMDNRYRKKEDFKRIIPQNISQRILDSLRYVTKEGGSGIRANVPGFTEGGKTGTANKIFNGTYSKEKYFSNFVGFTPAEKTKFVIFIGIDEPATTFIPGEGRMYYGSKSSAPIFKEIAKRSLKYLGVTIDDPYGVPKGDPKRQLEKSSWFQNVKKLNELSDMWNKF